MRKINYALKSKVLRDRPELLQEVRKIYTNAFAEINADNYGVVSPFLLKYRGQIPSMPEAMKVHALNGDLEEFIEAKRIVKAGFNRCSRLTTTIENMLNKAWLLDEKCLFLTFTFNDACLRSTNAQSRRKYITLFLKKYCDCYVANIDFGKLKGREHYHAVVLPYTKIDFKEWLKYGTIDYEYIHTPNSKALAKYTSKLTNHAIKETTKRSATIYSRG